MPRDGSGNYTQPFPIVISGHTIESEVYNGFTTDVTIDLNAPRPIVAGGTGASSAAAAMDALGGETSKTQVTNYDSHPFRAGSFYSDPGAAGAPIPGHSFSGICYPAVVSGVATTDMFIEIRDMDDFSAPPPVYVRQKKANVWSAWMVPATGGSDPSFSGVIKLNNRVVLTSPVPGAATNLTDTAGNPVFATGDLPGVGGSAVNSNYFGDKHTFKSRNAASTYAVLGPTNFAITLQLDAGIATCVAPALTDSSTRVPTTSWVKGAAADLIATTADYPQHVFTSPLAILVADLGKHLFHPVSDATTRNVTISSNTFDGGSGWPIGGTVAIVNFGGTVTLTPDANTHMFLAGTTLSGTRTLAGGTTKSIATIMKVADTGSTAELIIWGHGIT